MAILMLEIDFRCFGCLTNAFKLKNNSRNSLKNHLHCMRLNILKIFVELIYDFKHIFNFNIFMLKNAEICLRKLQV